jgi:5-methylcytosine-specific restriction endonuclease McrA
MSKSQAQIAANKERVRDRLTVDISTWSRECLLPYPSEFEHAIDLLLQAAILAKQGEDQNVIQAQLLIKQMADADMRSWFDDLAQNSGKVRLEILNRIPEKLPGNKMQKRPTAKLENQIIQDQGFHCRYCGIRLVSNKQLVQLQKIVGHEILPNRSRKEKRTQNTDVHGIWLLTRAAVDHVEPVAQGGQDVNRVENLVACCWSCNYGKGKYALKDLELDNPLCRPARKTKWSGLTDILS